MGSWPDELSFGQEALSDTLCNETDTTYCSLTLHRQPALSFKDTMVTVLISRMETTNCEPTGEEERWASEYPVVVL